MINKYFLSIIFLLIIFGGACLNTTNKKNATNDQTDSTALNKDVNNVIFSSQNIINNNIVWISPTDCHLSSIGWDGKLYNNTMKYAKLFSNGDCSVILMCFDEAGDIVPWNLSVVKAKIITKETLDVTPQWEDLGDDINHSYRNIYFEIYKDFKIKIVTEKGDKNKIQKYTKYYRINNEGKFYEVKE